MKFSVALNLERYSANESMSTVIENTLQLAKLVDQGGFETLWTSEHHTLECTIAPNPFQTLIWLGQHTEQVRLGTATLAAAYWNPIRLAGEAALCDHLTNGRLEFGIARGSYQYEFDRMNPGMVQTEGVAYMKEILPAVKELWKGDYAHQGHYWRFPKTAAVPKPMQKSGPPIWVAARDPGTFDWAIANGANIMSTPLSRPASEIQVLSDKFNKAVADHPEVARPKFMMQRRTCVYTKADDWEIPVRQSIEYGRLFENLMQNIGTVTDGFPEAVSYESVQGKENYDPHALHENLLFGTPEQVIQKLLIYEQAGVDQFCLGINFNSPFEWQLQTLRLFIDEVMPVFAERDRQRGIAQNAQS